MTPGLSASAIVMAWEAAEPRGPLDRALVLLWAAGEAEDPAALPLAERDRRLLELRHATFGEALPCVTECPDCGVALELELSARELGAALTAPQTETVEGDGARIELRLLDSRDIATAASLPEDEVTAFLRVRACDIDALPPDLVSEIDARIEARETAGELSFALECAACGAAWRESLDVPGHLWTEVALAARRIMSEVAEIARAYGWRERDILAMSEARRRVYLTLARGG